MTLSDEQVRKHCDRVIETINSCGFTHHNGIRVTKLELDYCEGELEITPECLNPLGIVHGGCLAALADTVGGMAALSRGKGTVTVSYGFNFLRPATGSRIKCVATPEKIGRTISVFRCVLTDDQDRLVASGQFTFNMIELDFTKES